MLSLSAAAGFGALGGLVMELLSVWQRLQAWQQARRLAAPKRKPLPAFASFIDPFPDALVVVTRAALGCVAGLVLRSEITGLYAALIAGASAPALLASLGKATTPVEALRAGAAGTGDAQSGAGT
jgi:hypothetical protein